MCPALDAGFFIWRPPGFRVCTYKPCAGEDSPNAELEGKDHSSLEDVIRVSPARHAPNVFGAFRWNRNQQFFDNRKAGKSTPIIVT
jgi:hypothetical protein